jgi:hypothetical protein
MSELANRPTAAENRAWLVAKLKERGIYEDLLVNAHAIVKLLTPEGARWAQDYSKAYSDGHNNRGLLGKHLDHYARAYADICEEVDAVAPELEMTLDAFWLLWDAGETFEGTMNEHWYFIS